VPISPAASDWNNWIVIEADSNDWHHLLACGDKWSPQANSLSGFLYASFDGGRSWQLKVADSSSGWVSEESCTFGPDGRAYFIADASRLIDGLTRHDLGQTHVYSSKDDGRTWSPPVVWDKWTDHNAVAVDNTVGRRRGAVYVFYNAFQDVKTERVERIEAGAYPVFSPDRSANVDEFRTSATTVGVFAKLPISARVLSDGSAIALFGTAMGFDLPSPIEVLTTNPDGTNPFRLTQVMRVVASPKCLSYPAMAIDNSASPSRGRIYVMGADASSGSCRVLMSSSSDNAKTWSAPVPVNIPNGFPTKPDSTGSFIFTMAVNRRGVIGLAWTEKELTCWHFSASTDGGMSFSPGVPLSECPNGGSLNGRFLNYYVEAYPGDDIDVENTSHSSTTTFSLRGSLGYVWRTSMATTPDGVFHPVWMENVNGGGQIWTASVSIGEDPHQTPPSSSGLQDISSHVTFDLANEFYDEATGAVFVDMAIVNRSGAQTRFRGPVLLKITDLRSDFGAVEVENSDNNERGVGTVWDLTSLIPSDGLPPGGISDRRTVWFRISNPKLPPSRLANLVVVQAKIFARVISQ